MSSLVQPSSSATLGASKAAISRRNGPPPPGIAGVSVPAAEPLAMEHWYPAVGLEPDRPKRALLVEPFKRLPLQMLDPAIAGEPGELRIGDEVELIERAGSHCAGVRERSG